MRVFFLLFIIIPIVEMWVLIQVGTRIGAWPTIAMVFLTAAIGLALLRQQGINTLLRVNQRMAQGELPASEILEGVMLAVGGALLLTPGFITDAFGFACLLPPTRKMMVKGLIRQGIGMAAHGQGGPNSYTHTQYTRFESSQAEHPRRRADNGDAIEGEFRRED